MVRVNVYREHVSGNVVRPLGEAVTVWVVGRYTKESNLARGSKFRNDGRAKCSTSIAQDFTGYTMLEQQPVPREKVRCQVQCQRGVPSFQHIGMVI